MILEQREVRFENDLYIDRQMLQELMTKRGFMLV